jgi:hypothetical protein
MNEIQRSEFIFLINRWFCRLCGYDFYAPIDHVCKGEW